MEKTRKENQVNPKMFFNQRLPWTNNQEPKINYKRENLGESYENAAKPFLANSEEVKPVEVIRRERNCPNPRPINVFLFLNWSKVSIFSYCPGKRSPNVRWNVKFS